jgi:hypothetical protein
VKFAVGSYELWTVLSSPDQSRNAVVLYAAVQNWTEDTQFADVSVGRVAWADMAGDVLQRKGEGDEPRKVQDIEKYCSPLTTMWLHVRWPGFKMNEICGKGKGGMQLTCASQQKCHRRRLEVGGASASVQRHAKMGRWDYHGSRLWKVGLKGC